MKYSLTLLAYNQQDFVAESVGSVLAQQCQPIEILLSDDCSTDRTFEIMQEIASVYKGPHSVVLNRNPRNLGVIEHIQRTHEMSTGDIIIYAAGDDISYPHRCERIIERFEATGALLVHSLADCVSIDGSRLPPSYLGSVMYHKTNAVDVCKSGSLYLGATTAYSKRLTEKFGHMRNPLLYEDLIIGFRGVLEGSVELINEPLLLYRVGSGITTKQKSTTSLSFRRGHFRRMYAVLGQRRRDCEVAGLDKQGHVVRKINRKRIRMLLGRIVLEKQFRRLLHVARVVARSSSANEF